MMSFEELIKYKFLGNTLLDYLAAGGTLLLSLLLLTAVKKLLFRKASRLFTQTNLKTNHKWIQIIVSLFQEHGSLSLWLASLYIASRFLHFSPKIEKFFSAAGTLLIGFIVIKILQSLISTWFERKYASLAKQDMARLSAMRNMELITKIGLWAIGVFFIMDNLGFDLTTIIAGLGIGAAFETTSACLSAGSYTRSESPMRRLPRSLKRSRR
jgi:DMSO reductase anchor subunit